MSTLSARAITPGRQYLHISDVDWATYSRLLHIFATRPGYRLAYDGGELEVMSPLLEHDDDGRILNDFVVILADECGLKLKHGGSTTMRRRKLEKGIESDDCYWIANAPRMAGRRRLNLQADPPPDLAIEVDVSHSSLDRMTIYAALKVPELWRLEGEALTFNALDEDGAYQPTERSLSFPLLTPAALLAFLQEARQSGDLLPILRRFREWVRKRLASRRPRRRGTT